MSGKDVANPWRFWPPNPKQPPRKLLLQQVAEQGDQLAAPWQQTANEQQRAHGHLALAIMYDELERPDDAVKHYQAARDLLTKLATQDPTATEYEVALADCYRQLARLQLEKDRAGASQDLEQGRTINRQLAANHKDPAFMQSGSKQSWSRPRRAELWAGSRT